MRIYLCGPINGCTDAEAKDWREAAKKALPEIEWVDPMVRDYRGRELEPGIADEIVEGDYRDIDECDLLLVNFPGPSTGTDMEIHYASFCREIPVYVVLPEGVRPSPWLLYHSDKIFRSFAEAFDALRS